MFEIATGFALAMTKEEKVIARECSDRGNLKVVMLMFISSLEKFGQVNMKNLLVGGKMKIMYFISIVILLSVLVFSAEFPICDAIGDQACVDVVFVGNEYV